MKKVKNMSQSKESSNLSKDYSTTVTILEHLSDALFILNPKGQVEYANRVALDMLGLKINEILGTQFNDFLNAEFDPNMLYDTENPNLLLPLQFELHLLPYHYSQNL